MADGATPTTSQGRRLFKPPTWWRKPVIYRLARSVHSYLSAFAFIGLMFFAATGFLLNHPEWLKSPQVEPEQFILQLELPAIEAAFAADDPGPVLAEMVRHQSPVIGAFSSAEVFEEDAMLRFNGVKGRTDVFIDRFSGEAEVETAGSGVMSVIRELHRGKDAGKAWRLLIDIIAIVTLVLSAIGFFLFFTMKFRLGTSLKLVGASLAVIAGLFVFFVP